MTTNVDSTKPFIDTRDSFSAHNKSLHTFLDDDFPYNKTLQVKVSDSRPDSHVTIKANVSQNKEGKHTLTDQIKFWFRPIFPSNSFFWMKGSLQSFKVHLEQKNININSGVINAGLSFAADNAFKNWTFHHILNHIHSFNKQTSFQTNLKFRLSKEVRLLHFRNILALNKYFFAFSGAVDLNSLAFKKRDLLVGLNFGKLNFYLRNQTLWSDQFRDYKGYLGKVFATAVYKDNNKIFGLEYSGVPASTNSHKFALAYQHPLSKMQNSSAKIKIDSKLRLGLGLKVKSDKLGCGVGLLLDLNKLNNVRWGTKLQIQL